MSLSLTQTLTAIGPGRTSSFAAIGGTPAYTYSVRPNGAGGVINASTGVYTGPAVASSDPDAVYDTIQVKDSVGAIATARVLVGLPLLLFCEILQKELGLADGRVYLWDQKLFQPDDNGLYIAVSVISCKPFANTFETTSTSGLDAVQVVNMMATLDIDAISRGPEARDHKEEIILALGSVYAQAQQEANSFLIGKLPAGGKFINLSLIDGAAIPYRFKISVNMQYAFKKTKAVDYYGTFQTVSVATNP